ncbi:MAG: twin-arginine translocase subunit TatB [Hyphomicrobiaceae bacterium]|nr:twin-arginine translocase subunit TatB [Hyphomicrobiaceae bacterium]
MFDITSSKLFLLAIVALLVIGPKDFPVLLRTIGKYVGIIRGHAREFRAQFDEAMRETELAEIKKDMENIAQEAEASFNATGREVEQTLNDAGKSVEASFENPLAPIAAVEPEAAAILDDSPATAPEPAPVEPLPAQAAVPAPVAVAQDESTAPPPAEPTVEKPTATPVGSPAPAQAAERTSA